MNIAQEFDHQLQHLLEKKYPEAANISEAEFLELVSPLKNLMDQIPQKEINLEEGHLPFVTVIQTSLVHSEGMMTKIEREGKAGIAKLFPHHSDNFSPIPSVQIPDAKAYLLVGIDRGKASLNVKPNEALQAIEAAGRTPLTIDEGIAIVTHYPEFLMKNNCFSLLASRHAGDQRVPAIWINGQKHPNLGWCWDGNPHTWLGSASAEKRLSI